MAVEIREISIGAKIVDEPPAVAPPAFDPKELREQILAECVDLIKKALERQGER
jgi:hypothetical protein